VASARHDAILGDGRLKAGKNGDPQLIPSVDEAYQLADTGDAGHQAASVSIGRQIFNGQLISESPGRLYSDISDGRDVYNGQSGAGRRPDGREMYEGPPGRAAHYASIQINPNFV